MKPLKLQNHSIPKALYECSTSPGNPQPNSLNNAGPIPAGSNERKQHEMVLHNQTLDMIRFTYNRLLYKPFKALRRKSCCYQERGKTERLPGFPPILFENSGCYLLIEMYGNNILRAEWCAIAFGKFRWQEVRAPLPCFDVSGSFSRISCALAGPNVHVSKTGLRKPPYGLQDRFCFCLWGSLFPLPAWQAQ